MSQAWRTVPRMTNPPRYPSPEWREQVERLERIRSTTFAVIGTLSVPQQRLTELVVAALAAEVPEALVREHLAAVVENDGRLRVISSGVVHPCALMASIEWMVNVHGLDAIDDSLPIDDELAPLEWWTRSAGKTVMDGRGHALGPVRRLLIHTESDDDDTDAEIVDEDRIVLRGPSGWLMPFAGSTVALSTNGSVLHISASSRVTRPSSRQVRAVKTGFTRAIDSEPAFLRSLSEPGHELVSVDACLIEAVAADRGAFRLGPVPPLADLLAAAGLGLRRGAVQRVALAA